MIEKKIYCQTCKEEKEVKTYEKVMNKQSFSETIELDCGHKIFRDEIYDEVKITDELRDKVKRPGFKRPIYEGKQTHKISKKGIPAKESLFIDRLNKKKIHKVWEIDENGNEILVHNEDDPLDPKMEKT